MMLSVLMSVVTSWTYVDSLDSVATSLSTVVVCCTKVLGGSDDVDVMGFKEMTHGQMKNPSS